MSTATRTLLLAMLLYGGVVSAAATEQITITRMSGSVTVLAAGSKVDVRVGSSLTTPLRIETASDGSLHIEQESSGLDIGPNSIVVLPGTAPASAWEKVRQEVGRVLYSVKPRKTRSFAVETPYLVSVVKGTTFSVAVDERSATVALLEGSVEVGNPDIDERVLLKPNQTARRAAGERSIAVTTLDAKTPPQARTGTAQSPLAQTTPDPNPAAAIHSDLREITAAYSDRRAHTRGSSSPPPVALPPTPEMPQTPGSPPSAPPPPDTSGDSPGSDPAVPLPLPDAGDQDEDDDDHGHDDDDNNGQGNDDDGEDEGNRGKGRDHRHRR